MVTVHIKENSKQAKKFLEYIKTLPFVEFIEKEENPKGKNKTKNYPVSKNVPNAETLKAMRNAEKGIGVKKFDSVEELFKDLEI